MAYLGGSKFRAPRTKKGASSGGGLKKRSSRGQPREPVPNP